MRKSTCLVALILLGASGDAFGQTMVPLNTGYNHSNFTVYPAPGSATVLDNYWVKVAANYPPINVPAFVINTHPAWQAPLSGGGFPSQWIGSTTPDGKSPPIAQRPYAIYRKCFCLMPGYQKAELSFQMRGDDFIQVWLNTVTSTIVTAQNGSFSGPPISGTAQPSQFRRGVNCLYVLVEDPGGIVSGFNLAGTVSAFGLMPMAAAGRGISFAPCQCEGDRRTALEDRATIQAIVKIAEDRQRR
ncbi:MAG TPA: hypothetical protein VF782_13150 [Allosphingosinicella sp.]|jgi:hypothetical protein